MIQIREAKYADWERIREIYLGGMNTKNATFETEDQIPSCEDWFNSKITGSIFVSEESDFVTGWVILSPVSNRCVYNGVAEVSVYVDLNFNGMGIGAALLEKSIAFADANNIWTIESNMFKRNVASKKVHEKVGFKVLGVREKLGQLDGQWVDILMMERRSTVII